MRDNLDEILVSERTALVSRMGRRRNRAEGTALSAGAAPNDLWCADFKSLSHIQITKNPAKMPGYPNS